jgi:hypothetical protein
VVVRSKKKEDHIQDLRETIANLRRHGLKLNLEKCVFGVRRGKLLGCMIVERGIKANPEKIEAIRQMKPPTTKKGVQKLTSRLASLNRFISMSAEKCLPFFKALKGSGNMEWGEEQAKAFEAQLSPALQRRRSCCYTSLHQAQLSAQLSSKSAQSKGH